MMSGKLDSGKASAPDGGSQWMRHAVIGMVCALVIGIFAWSAESGFLELASPHAEDSYYNLLVQGFRAGQLNVKREAPPGLTQLANPYDPAINASYVWDRHNQSYEMSYYKGKLYLYFGVTPALVLFWPYVTLTGHYLPDKDAVVVFFSLGFLAVAGLLRAVWRRYFPEVSVWVATVGILTLGLATGILEILSRCDVYEVARSCGFAFTMLALAAIWRALHEPKRQVFWLSLASLAYGLAVGSRPSLLFGVVVLLLPVAQGWRAATESSSRRRVGLLLVAAVGPVMLIGLGLMLYNTLRFDSPFEFGWHYQLTSYGQNAARQFSLHYLWFNFRFNFLEPMQWSGHFPFFQAFPPSPLPSGYDGVGEPYGGILSNYPVVWLSLAAPLVWRARPVEAVSVLRWFLATVFLLFVACALTLCLFFAASSSYESDYLPALMLLAVIGILGLERALVGSPVWRRIARWGWCLLLAYSVAFNILASVDVHATTNWLAGNFLLNQGRVDEAVERFQMAQALEPESATFHFALGNALCREKRMDEAIIQYQKALELKPDSAEANNNLAYTLLQTGRVNEAITHFQRALEIQQSYEAYYNLGCAFRRNRMATEAMACYQKAMELQPQFIPAQIDLAWMLATWPEPSVRNGGKAIVLAKQANQLSRGKDAQILRTLAAAYAEAGQFPEAVLTAKQALVSAAAESNKGLTDVLQTEIRLYQTDSPCRSTNN
jgi:cytochrome c-type biogenesis protein CcmH/NrfG